MKRLALALVVALAGCGGGSEGPGPSDPRPLRIVEPPGGGEGHALVVFLHGRGQSVESVAGDGFDDGYAALGDDAPVVAFPYGGESSYWHDRESGKWGSDVVDKVIPRVLRETGADPDRVAIGGISMGGFGALDIAEHGERGFCAVGAHSPAIFQSAGETPEGAFDDADDYARHDVIADAAALPDVPVRLDIGSDDPLRAGAEAFAAAAGEELVLSPGGHDSDYWNAQWPAYLRFYSETCQKSS